MQTCRCGGRPALASSSGRPSPVREVNASRKMGAVPRSLPGLQFRVLPERWERKRGRGKLVGLREGRRGSQGSVVSTEGRGGWGRRSWGKELERLGRGEEGARGPRRGRAPARATLQPRLACPTASGQSVRPAAWRGDLPRSPILSE